MLSPRCANGKTTTSDTTRPTCRLFHRAGLPSGFFTPLSTIACPARDTPHPGTESRGKIRENHQAVPHFQPKTGYRRPHSAFITFTESGRSERRFLLRHSLKHRRYLTDYKPMQAVPIGNATALPKVTTVKERQMTQNEEVSCPPPAWCDRKNDLTASADVTRLQRTPIRMLPDPSGNPTKSTASTHLPVHRTKPSEPGTLIRPIPDSPFPLYRTRPFTGSLFS